MSVGVKVEQTGEWYEQAWALFLIVLLATVGGIFTHTIMIPTRVTAGKIDWKFPACPRWVNIPPLVGMIIAGCLARNFCAEQTMQHYPVALASILRIVCLSIILMRGGLELDFHGKGLTMVLLTLCPQIFEATAAAIATRVILGYPWAICFAHGFTLGAVSPAVVVPSCMYLHRNGYGVEKGIPTSMIAASSFDDIIAITAFGVFKTVAFNEAPGGIKEEGDTIGWEIGMNLIQLATGLGAGFFLGYCAYVFQLIPKGRLRTGAKIAYLLVVAIAMPVICEQTAFSEAKFVGIIFFGYACYRVWGEDKPESQLAFFWMFCQPVLFGTVGAEVQFKNIKPAMLGTGIGIIAIGLTFRWIGAFVACLEPKYNNKERAFVAFGWIPKATVQAALGGIVGSTAAARGIKEWKDMGDALLTMAVFAIVLTAPTGAILFAQLGPRWLQKKPGFGDDDEKKEELPDAQPTAEAGKELEMIK